MAEEKKVKHVLGISGGKDSSIVAALCVEALGADRVTLAFLCKTVYHIPA